MGRTHRVAVDFGHGGHAFDCAAENKSQTLCYIVPAEHQQAGLDGDAGRVVLELEQVVALGKHTAHLAAVVVEDGRQCQAKPAAEGCAVLEGDLHGKGVDKGVVALLLVLLWRRPSVAR